MAFEEVVSLDCDETISLGGFNKKTGKANPTKIEGYYLGKREVEDRKKKSGVSYIYAFQTPKGKIGVWGKTDLDRKMLSVAPGTMTRVIQEGSRATPNGDMYLYKVAVDKSNTIDVGGLATEASASAYDGGNDDGDGFEGESFADDMDDDSAMDEVAPTRAQPPKRTASVDAERQAKVQALLNKGRTSKSA